MAQFEKNSLQDILDKGRMRELARDRIETIFPVYKPKDEIALNIFKALNARLIDLGSGKLGIPMDDNEKKGWLVIPVSRTSDLGFLG